ncbi:MAG: bactofilin family protein [Bacteroidota bacterium]
MFSKQNKSKSPAASNSTAPDVSMISKGTRLEGDIHAKGDLRISGNVTGTASSDGKLVITSTGRVEGNVKAGEVDIAGMIDGELRVSSKLILRSSAVINGDLYAKTLLVEEGAQIRGHCRMTEESSELKSIRGNSKRDSSESEGTVRSATGGV